MTKSKYSQVPEDQGAGEYGQRPVAMQASPNFEDTLRQLVGDKKDLVHATAMFGGAPKIKNKTTSIGTIELEDGTRFTFYLSLKSITLRPGQRGPSGEPVYGFDFDIKQEMAPSAASMGEAVEVAPAKGAMS